jgi:hypothetical protein
MHWRDGGQNLSRSAFRIRGRERIYLDRFWNEFALAEADVVGQVFGTIIAHRWCIVHGSLAPMSGLGPCYGLHQVGRSSGVNQEVNFFWQNGGNVSDDVTP